MSESRSPRFRPPLYYGDGSKPNGENNDGNRTRKKASDETGWDAYRKWLASVGKHERTTRSPIDRSVYSWKGYHSWANRIKQQWKSEAEDS